MNFIFIFIIVLFQLGFVLAQSIPRDHFYYQSRKLLYDAGKDWKSLTVFGPIRYKSKSEKQYKILNSFNYFDGQIGIDAGNESYSLYGYWHFKYNNHYYGYLYPTFVRKTDKNHSFDMRTNLINNHDNHSGIGYENSWATLQLGKGKESWGAGNDIQLALSENSGTYDYFLLASDYGKVRVRYIYGFLENVETNINRYITARGFEWTNERSLIIGISEIVIYSGENRSIDLGYLNPISSHLEIELNNRLNNIGDTLSNAVWQFSLDWLIKNNLRLSGNFLIDEFVIDKIEREWGKEHGSAFSFRFVYTPIKSTKTIFSTYVSYVRVGTPTFRHGRGSNNFVIEGKPLGWQLGSDGNELKIGFNYKNNRDMILYFSSGINQLGDEAIIFRPYDSYLDYEKGSFPSGRINRCQYIHIDYYWKWKENLYLMLATNWNDVDSAISMKVGININYSL